MRTRSVILAVALVVCLGAPARATDPAAACKEKKARATGRKAADVLRALGQYQKNPDSSWLDANIARAHSKFTSAFAKAEGGELCAPTTDVGAIEAKVDAFVASVGIELSGFVDNGDGTITDPVTGLMWEKKDRGIDGPDPTNLHDVDNDYTWAGCCDGDCSTAANYCQPNPAAASACSTETGGVVGCSPCSVGTCDVDPSGRGAITTIWDWLAQLKAAALGGHTDWRIPGVNRDGGAAELETILLAPSGCSTGPHPCVALVFDIGCTGGCTVTTCSCTAPDSYWSSTTYADLPNLARYVYFYNGSWELTSSDKPKLLHVRAVRGGLPPSPSGAFLAVTAGVLD